MRKIVLIDHEVDRVGAVEAEGVGESRMIVHQKAEQREGLRGSEAMSRESKGPSRNSKMNSPMRS